jgi:hypothetical protein
MMACSSTMGGCPFTVIIGPLDLTSAAMFCSSATLLVDRSLPVGKAGGTGWRYSHGEDGPWPPPRGVAEAMAAGWLGAAYGPQEAGRSAGLPVHGSCVFSKWVTSPTSWPAGDRLVRDGQGGRRGGLMRCAGLDRRPNDDPGFGKGVPGGSSPWHSASLRRATDSASVSAGSLGHAGDLLPVMAWRQYLYVKRLVNSTK